MKRRRLAPQGTLHTASEKAQAVLAIWMERVKTAQVMKTMGVTYLTLQQWQERAMEGMLQALEPRVNLADGAVLSPLDPGAAGQEAAAGRQGETLQTPGRAAGDCSWRGRLR